MTMTAVEDPREAIATFTLQGYEVEVFGLSIMFTAHVIFLFLVEVGISCLLAVITYYGVVKQRDDDNKKSTTNHGKQTALLVGWGIVVPVATYLPWMLIDTLDVSNVGARMMLIPPPMIVVLRCLEAMAGFTPTGPKSSLREFVYYMGWFLIPKRDPKTDKAMRSTVPSILKQASTVLPTMLLLGALLSFFRPRQYEVCPTKSGRSPTEVFVAVDTCQLLSTYVQAGTYVVAVAPAAIGALCMFVCHCRTLHRQCIDLCCTLIICETHLLQSWSV